MTITRRNMVGENVSFSKSELNLKAVRTSSGARTLNWLSDEVEKRRQRGNRIVTTNGCFDLIHPGHVDFLNRARQEGDLLIVLLNTDDSIRQIKGDGRPIVAEEDRAAILLGLRSVDYVVLFDDLLPSRQLDMLHPDVHCKGGDYTVAQLPEALIVQRHGGQVRILSLHGSYSSSSIIERILIQPSETVTRATDSVVSPEQVCRMLLSGSNVLRQTGYTMQSLIVQVAGRMAQAIQTGNKILVCGNGGSAADAQHFVAELVGRYRRERVAWPAVALTVDTSILTAIGNDYGFDQVFARQVQALGRAGDVLLAISTSGKSPNVLNAVKSAKALSIWTVGLTGSATSPLPELTDVCLQSPTTDTPLIQLTHIAILHVFCEILESIVHE